MLFALLYSIFVGGLATRRRLGLRVPHRRNATLTNAGLIETCGTYVGHARAEVTPTTTPSCLLLNTRSKHPINPPSGPKTIQ